MSAILGWRYMAENPQHGFIYLAIWIICVFVSILIHEMGHVFMGRLFGTDGHILLHGFGGLAIGSNAITNPWKRIAVSFAGPLVQFMLFGVLFWVARQGLPRSPFFDFALKKMLLINLIWPIFNLLPVIPLDGGQILHDFLGWIAPRRGVRAALALSATVAGVLALNSLSGEYRGPTIPYVPALGLYAAFLFGMMAAGNLQALSQETERKRWVEDHHVYYEDDHERWDR
jgi:Zn-dependent protease